MVDSIKTTIMNNSQAVMKQVALVSVAAAAVYCKKWISSDANKEVEKYLHLLNQEKQTCQQLQNEIKDSEKDIEVYKKRIHDLEIQQANTKIEIDQFNQELESQRQQNLLLLNQEKERCQQLQDEIEASKKTFEDYKQSIDDLQQQLANNKIDIDQFNQQLESQRQKYRTLQEEFELLKVSDTAKQINLNEIRKVNEKIAADKLRVEEELQCNKMNIDDLQQQLANNKIDIDQFNQQLESQKQKYRTLQEEFNLLKVSDNEKQINLDEIRKVNENITADKLRVEEELKMQGSEVQRLQKNISDLSSEKIALEDEIGHLNQDIMQQKATIQDLKLRKLTNTVKEGQYDFQFLFNSLHAFEKGIEVKCSTTLEQFIDQTKKCIIIALIGGYNNGKSFLGAKMTGKPFPQGNDLKTEGFNMLLHKYEGLPQKFIYVDSSGSGEATQMCGELTKKSNDNLQNQDDLQKEYLQIKTAMQDYTRQKIVSEKFVQQFLVEKSNIILLMVDALSSEDEKLINFIRESFNKNQLGNQKKLYIVHNYVKISSQEELDGRIQKDILNCFPVTIYQDKVDGFDVTYYRDSFVETHQLPIDHVILTNENYPLSQKINQGTISWLNQEIKRTQSRLQQVNLLDDLLKYSTDKLKSLLRFTGPNYSDNQELMKLDLKWNEDKTKIYSPFMQKQSGQIELRPILFDVFGQMIIHESDRDRTPEFEIKEDNTSLIVSVEVAGLDQDTWRQQVRYCFRIGSVNFGELFLHLEVVKNPKPTPQNIQQSNLPSTIIYGKYVLQQKITNDRTPLKWDDPTNRDTDMSPDCLQHDLEYKSGDLIFTFPKIGSRQLQKEKIQVV